MESRIVARWTRCLAAVALVAAAGGCGGSTPTSPPTTSPPSTTGGGGTADVVITIVGIAGGMSYSPNPASVKVGQRVAWRNADNIAHTATQTGNGGFDTGTVAGGATSAPLTMAAAGSLSYFCQIHPSMVGTLNVTP